MSGAHSRKLKFLQLSLGELDSPDTGDEISFGCQVEKWEIVNNTPDGEKRYSFCWDPNLTEAENLANGEFIEEPEPDYSLTATLYADWRSAGISTYLWQHDGETVNFRTDHHPDIETDHVYWLGRVQIKAPNVGGEPRTTEMSEISLKCVGKPAFFRGDEES